MEDKLTIPEITYMRALAGIKTDEELAKMMDKPVELIVLQFSIMANLPKRPNEKPEAIAMLLSSPSADPVGEAVKGSGKKRGPKPKEPAQGMQKKKVKKMREVDSVPGEVSTRKQAWKKKNDKPQFKTKKLDLKGQVSYRLNSKTVVWDKPGADIKELKKKYKIA